MLVLKNVAFVYLLSYNHQQIGAAADLSSEALFSLFECLAVLVHLRKLAHPAIPLDEAEEELLFQFEHSGEWLPDDTTLVADWYWRTSAALLSH